MPEHVRALNIGTPNGTVERLYYSGYAASNFGSELGRELWYSDGTTAGTKFVDLNPGAEGSYPEGFTSIGDFILFGAWNATVGMELWTQSYEDPLRRFTMVKDINPHGNSLALPVKLLVLQHGIYFVATDGQHGFELWKTDSTAAGTVMVADLNPTGNGVCNSEIFAIQNTLYFCGTNGANGQELWKYDGVSFTLVKDIAPGSNASQQPYSGKPSNFANINGTLYFKAYTPTQGFELWKSNGTTVGTTLVKDIWPNTGDSNPAMMTSYTTPGGQNIFFFVAKDPTSGEEVWRSDGTVTGTLLLKDINPGYSSSYPTIGIAAHGVLYFYAHNALGNEIWATNGTTAGTVVKEICPGGGWAILNTEFQLFHGQVYISASNCQVGRELWAIPAVGVPYLIKDINISPPGGNPQDYDSNPDKFAAFSNKLFFSAMTDAVGDEMWVLTP